ncbi:MAG: DUF3800 domain-containing protein [Propionibacteriaceae bacterium]|nr:DUF3800 domain-containing protein [Propionibacteriaceae bacterium]
MADLSIFADESGDFGDQSYYYIISLVFHEQQHNISGHIAKLAESLSNVKDLSQNHTIHTGAAIRREDEYRTIDIETRKAVFTRLFAFARSAPITHQAFHFRKKEHTDRLALKGAISRTLGLFLRDNASYFLSFDRVVIYYDNGQSEITEVLNTLFNGFLFNVEFRKVMPSQYRLFQVADLCCTLELMQVKIDTNQLSRSELFFFRGKRLLKKDYLDKWRRQRLNPQ